jgi:hypothetical protein
MVFTIEDQDKIFVPTNDWHAIRRCRPAHPAYVKPKFPVYVMTGAIIGFVTHRGKHARQILFRFLKRTPANYSCYSRHIGGQLVTPMLPNKLCFDFQFRAVSAQEGELKWKFIAIVKFQFPKEMND